MWNLMNASLKALLNEQYKLVAELREENKKLKEEIKSRQDEVERFKTNAVQDMAEITELEEENKILKERIEALELCIDVD